MAPLYHIIAYHNALFTYVHQIDVRLCNHFGGIVYRRRFFCICYQVATSNRVMYHRPHLARFWSHMSSCTCSVFVTWLLTSSMTSSRRWPTTGDSGYYKSVRPRACACARLMCNCGFSPPPARVVVRYLLITSTLLRITSCCPLNPSAQPLDDRVRYEEDTGQAVDVAKYSGWAHVSIRKKD